ncbi:MAG: SUMF1/EgtB/PvdO family nonheme iron enzyme [Alphaproteobacteria bacterium]|nr:SUMF1/EgtB/PvdO family nonheme iron enzyme [Alphaproteobacteria bacterium]
MTTGTTDDPVQAVGSSTSAPTRLVAEAARGAAQAAEDPFMPLAPGTVLNNTHRIERLLARGGMGEVYRAANLLTGDAVALKVIRPELVNEPNMRALFLREATALRKIRHPAIVAYEGVHAEASGRVYLAMDLIEGPSLSKRLADGPLTVAQVRALRRRLAQGLLAAHEQNIVHRDLSPDNVVLRDGDLEKATVIDFGIAKKTDGIATSVIGSSFAGKMEYASPEQMGLFGNAVDARSDVYSLGLVLAAAALGRPLGMAQTPALAIEARKRLPDLSALPPALRSELTPMLQPDPARRLASMREVLAFDEPGTARGGRGLLRRGRLVTAAVAALAVVVALLSVTRPALVVDVVSRASAALGLPIGQPGDEAAEEAAWSRARAAETVPAVRAFLGQFPAGRYAAEARSLITELEQRSAATRAVPGQTFRDCPSCPEMVWLPKGSFTMGSSPEERRRENVPAVWGDAEGPPHDVTLSYGLAMGKYEVTLGEFAAFVQATGHPMGGSCWRNPGFEQSYRDPVVCVSWTDVRAYADWLTRTTGKTYRLPSEAEWEYGARAGSRTARFWGDGLEQLCRHANVLEAGFKCPDSPPNTAPVGQLQPNAFQLYDMLGNVAEWVEDCWTARYDGAPSDGSARLSGNCAQRVTRGGSWNSDPWRIRSATRSGTPAVTRNGETGFRVVRTD